MSAEKRKCGVNAARMDFGVYRQTEYNMVILKGSVTMSGHSKWNNIKRKKEKTDEAKAKVFTKIGREISVIDKTGGANPNENSKLKDAIAKAKAANVPNENIERIIKKAAGDGSVDKADTATLTLLINGRTEAEYAPYADINRDGYINEGDISALEAIIKEAVKKNT